MKKSLVVLLMFCTFVLFAAPQAIAAESAAVYDAYEQIKANAVTGGSNGGPQWFAVAAAKKSDGTWGNFTTNFAEVGAGYMNLTQGASPTVSAGASLNFNGGAGAHARVGLKFVAPKKGVAKLYFRDAWGHANGVGAAFASWYDDTETDAAEVFILKNDQKIWPADANSLKIPHSYTHEAVEISDISVNANDSITVVVQTNFVGGNGNNVLANPVIELSEAKAAASSESTSAATPEPKKSEDTSSKTTTGTSEAKALESKREPAKEEVKEPAVVWKESKAYNELQKNAKGNKNSGPNWITGVIKDGEFSIMQKAGNVWGDKTLAFTNNEMNVGMIVAWENDPPVHTLFGYPQDAKSVISFRASANGKLKLTTDPSFPQLFAWYKEGSKVRYAFYKGKTKIWPKNAEYAEIGHNSNVNLPDLGEIKLKKGEELRLAAWGDGTDAQFFLSSKLIANFAADTAAASSGSSNPETGDPGMMLAVVAAAGSAAVLLKRLRK